MRANIHELVVRATEKLLPPKIRENLSKKINFGEYGGKTRLDLILLGAVIEDSNDTPSPLGIPDFAGVKEATLEHFWNTNLEEHKGLVVEELFSPFPSALDRAVRYWDYHVLPNHNEGKLDAYINLGRVLHLLTDVGVPSHVHGDMHTQFPLKFINDDDYEDYTENYVKENQLTLPYQWDVTEDADGYPPKIVYSGDWNLKDYFYELGKISRLYDSDGCDGLGSGYPYRYGRFDRDFFGDLTDKSCFAIASELIPTTILFVAGVICYFYKCIHFGQLIFDELSVKIIKMYVIDDTDSSGQGELYLSASLYGPLIQIGGKHGVKSGHPVNIDATLPPQLISNKLDIVRFSASVKDDDNDFPWEDDDWENLGWISFDITPYDYIGEPKIVTLTSDLNKYQLDIEISLKENVDQQETFESQIQSWRSEGKIADDYLTMFSQTKFNLKNYPPLLINLGTMALHSLACGNSRNCKKWENLDDHKKLRLFMFEYEPFKEKDGKTMLSRFAEQIYEEDSKQAQAARESKGFKSRCSCTK